MMHRLLWVCLTLAWAAAASAQDKGEIKVQCPPGVEVFLDAESRGTTREGALSIQFVPAGRHRLKLVRPGYKPLELEVTVEAGKTAAPAVGAFQPDVKTSETGEEPPWSLKDKTGWVVVKSQPAQCQVSCAALGLDARKTRDPWSAFGVPPGKWTLRFSAGAQAVDHELELKPGTKVFLFVNLETRRVGVNQGEIQVRCDGEAEVLVDGAPRGTTQDGGLLVRDVAPGKRKVRVERFGHRPIEGEVRVEAGAAAEHRVSSYDWKPLVLVFDGTGGPDEKARPKLWRLVVKSLPARCAIDCYDLDLKSAPKTAERWEAWGVQEKRVSLTFVAGDKRVYQDVHPRVGKTTFVMVYFERGRAELDKGEIAVQAPPGITVSVAGQKGQTTEKEGGLVLRDLAPGKVTVKLEKPDCQPQELEVAVEPGETARVVPRTFRPILVFPEEGKEPDPKMLARTGTLLVRGPECAIDCEGLGLEKVKKTAEDWLVYGVPAGRFELAFTAGGRTLKHAAEFRPGRRSRLEVDFGGGQVRALPAGLEDFGLAAEVEGHEQVVFCVAISPDGRLAATGSRDKTIRLWDLAHLREWAALPVEEYADKLLFSPDGKALVVSHGTSVFVWDLARMKAVRELKIEGRVSALAWSKAESLVFASAWSNRDSVVVAWRYPGFEEARTFRIKLWLRDMAVTPDGKTLVVIPQSDEPRVRLLSAGGGQETKKLASHKAELSAMALTPDGSLLASASEDGVIRLWSLPEGKAKKSIRASPEAIKWLAWMGGGKVLAAGGSDTKVRLLDVESGQAVKVLAGRRAAVTCGAVSPDEKTIVSAAPGRKTRVTFWRVLE